MRVVSPTSESTCSMNSDKVLTVNIWKDLNQLHSETAGVYRFHSERTKVLPASQWTYKRSFNSFTVDIERFHRFHNEPVKGVSSISWWTYERGCCNSFTVKLWKQFHKIHRKPMRRLEWASQSTYERSFIFTINLWAKFIGFTVNLWEGYRRLHSEPMGGVSPSSLRTQELHGEPISSVSPASL